MSVYTDNGFNSRGAYLRDLSDEYGVPLSTVKMLASMLGSSEDFDGLVSALEDYDEDSEDFDFE
jgi:hypothetical protein